MKESLFCVGRHRFPVRDGRDARLRRSHIHFSTQRMALTAVAGDDFRSHFPAAGVRARGRRLPRLAQAGQRGEGHGPAAARAFRVVAVAHHWTQ